MVRIVGKPLAEHKRLFAPCQFPWQPATARGMEAFVVWATLHGPHSGYWLIDSKRPAKRRLNPKTKRFELVIPPKRMVTALAAFTQFYHHDSVTRANLLRYQPLAKDDEWTSEKNQAKWIKNDSPR